MKLCGEDLVKDYQRRGAFDYAIIRPSAVYGPLDVEDRVVANLCSQPCEEAFSALMGQGRH
jgi:nucleoside-diphosphate-sugar epimerase